MIVFVFALVGFGFIFYLAFASVQQTNQRRAGVQAQIDALREQMCQYVAQSRSLDAKTQERVGQAQASVEEKLTQASALLKVAAKERHYERIGRILALVQTKLSNVQSSMGRAQARTDERVQRQADNARRKAESMQQRTGSFGQRATLGTPRTGSFAPPAQVTGATTSWNTIPLRERGVCFFCSRPCLLRELTPVTVPIGGTARRVLACPPDFATVQAGTLPPIRAFSLNGQPVPWFAYSRYNPYNDYYMDGGGINVYVDTFPYSAFDPGYWDFNGPYGYDDGQAYNFSPDTEAYQDYASGLAAGEAAGAMLNADSGTGNTGGMDFQGMDVPANFANNPDGQMPIGPDQS